MAQETTAQLEERLLTVIAKAQFEVLEGSYAFQEPPAGPTVLNPQALAYVRDGATWTQLAPVSDSGSHQAVFKMVSFHFAPGIDASGFVAWLASHLKRTVGTGVIVICGKDRRRDEALYAASQGVFDYWGCPVQFGDRVIAAVRALIDEGRARLRGQ